MPELISNLQSEGEAHYNKFAFRREKQVPCSSKNKCIQGLFIYGYFLG